MTLFKIGEIFDEFTFFLRWPVMIGGIVLSIVQTQEMAD